MSTGDAIDGVVAGIGQAIIQTQLLPEFDDFMFAQL